MIEYHRKDVAQQIRRVTAREFKELEELRSVYRTVRIRARTPGVDYLADCSSGG